MKKTTKTARGGRGGAGSHELYQRVKKKAGTIKASSRRWLERHLNDPYVHQSKIDGYRSRAAYKLIEINNRYKILKKGQKIIDLGAVPGGWCQVAVQIVGSNNHAPSVVGIDYLHMDPLPGVVALEMDFFHEEAEQQLMSVLKEKPDVILSDMAAPTTGHRYTDHLKTIHLCEAAAYFAISVLKPGGHFLAKTFQGGAESALLATLKQNFKKVHHVKPPSSRAESVELYILALQFKGEKGV
ncbi:RlmE family RNA methyltransferase [Bartonella ancashensis]|uniref:Ribosomal RNA large subunit methyltransferase E n=1 Tax=Bartonella ancashensis TaxID=1318743 RepID=A0A0M4M4M2_9HYPH|nr:RlmE family RNA methyltransferase [Bartonella ancashensis]ALE04149.1 Cell division protein FtsJ [Bartonella ancashensis]